MFHDTERGFEFMTIGQVARICDEPQSTIRQWIASGLLAIHQLPDGSVRISVPALALFWVLHQSGQTDFPRPDVPEAD
jgi:hypothetical protein